MGAAFSRHPGAAARRNIRVHLPTHPPAVRLLLWGHIPQAPSRGAPLRSLPTQVEMERADCPLHSSRLSLLYRLHLAVLAFDGALFRRRLSLATLSAFSAFAARWWLRAALTVRRRADLLHRLR